MKHYLYKGQIVTASSKEEAIKVISKLDISKLSKEEKKSLLKQLSRERSDDKKLKIKERLEKLKLIKAKWKKQANEIYKTLTSMFGSDYIISNWNNRERYDFRINDIKNHFNDYDVRTMPLSRAGVYIRFIVKPKNLWSCSAFSSDEGIVEVIYDTNEVTFSGYDSWRKADLKDVPTIIKASTKFKKIAKLGMELNDKIIEYSNKKDKTPIVPMLENYYKVKYNNNESMYGSRIHNAKLHLRIKE